MADEIIQAGVPATGSLGKPSLKRHRSSRGRAALSTQSAGRRTGKGSGHGTSSSAVAVGPGGSDHGRGVAGPGGAGVGQPGGRDTREAVWAFKEVQGFPINFANQDLVSIAVERRLVHPLVPKVLVPRGGSMRIEVNLTNETLVLYNHNKVELISHVSTGPHCLPNQGCGWDTPIGSYHTIWYAPGWIHVRLGVMYNSVFFIGSKYAIHGETNPNVPFFPDSHGCVRIPFDIAGFFHTLIKIPGTPVYTRKPKS